MMTSIIDLNFFMQILEHLWEKQPHHLADFLQRVVEQDKHIIAILASICRDKRLRFTDELQNFIDKHGNDDVFS